MKQPFTLPQCDLLVERSEKHTETVWEHSERGLVKILAWAEANVGRKHWNILLLARLYLHLEIPLP